MMTKILNTHLEDIDMLTKFKATSIALTGLLATSTAFATTAAEQDEWQFALSPYIWLTDHQGHAGIPGQDPVDISSKDILDDLKFGVAFVASAQKGNHAIHADYSYSSLVSNESLDEISAGLVLDVDTVSTIFSLAYGYQVVDSNNTKVQLLAGARYWDVSYDYSIKDLGGLSASKSWVDAMVGVWGRHDINNSKVFVSGGANVGGLSSDYFYDVIANVGYQWTPSISTVLGYRHFDVKYNSDDFAYDVNQKGFQLGLTWSF